MGKACAEHSKDKVIHFCRKSNCDAKSRIICNSCVNMGNHKKHFHMSLDEVQTRFDDQKSAFKKIESQIDQEFIQLQNSITKQVQQMHKTIDVITEFMDTLDNIRKNYQNYINNLNKKYKGQLQKIKQMTTIFNQSITKIDSIKDRKIQDQINDLMSTIPEVEKDKTMTESLLKFFKNEIDEYNYTSRLDEDFIRDITEQTKQHLQKFLLDFNINTFKGKQTQSLLGHMYMVLCVEKIDENFIVTAGVDQSIKLWNIEKMEEQQSIKNAHVDSIRALVKMNNSYLISGGTDNSIKLWNIKKIDQHKYELSEKQEVKNAHDDWIQSISRIDNETFASGGFDRQVKVWKIIDDQEKIECQNVFQLTGKVAENSITISGNNHMIVCDQDRWISIIDLNKNEVLKQMQTETMESENCLMIYDDVDVFCSASNKTISFWRISDGKLIKKHEKMHNGQINRLEKLDANLILSVGCDMTARIWRVSENYDIEEVMVLEEADKIFASRRIWKDCIITAGWNEKVIVWK